MCGRVEDNLLRTIVESVELAVCEKCSKFGKVLGPVRKNIPKPKPRFIAVAKEEVTEEIVENYSELIKKKRDSLGISQKDFALKLNEKESIIHNIETGHLEPSMALAGKLEKILGIKLIYKVKEEISEKSQKKEKEEGFTLGDFIKTRK